MTSVRVLQESARVRDRLSTHLFLAEQRGDSYILCELIKEFDHLFRYLAQNWPASNDPHRASFELRRHELQELHWLAVVASERLNPTMLAID